MFTLMSSAFPQRHLLSPAVKATPERKITDQPRKSEMSKEPNRPALSPPTQVRKAITAQKLFAHNKNCSKFQSADKYLAILKMFFSWLLELSLRAGWDSILIVACCPLSNQVWRCANVSTLQSVDTLKNTTARTHQQLWWFWSFYVCITLPWGETSFEVELVHMPAAVIRSTKLPITDQTRYLLASWRSRGSTTRRWHGEQVSLLDLKKENSAKDFLSPPQFQNWGLQLKATVYIGPNDRHTKGHTMPPKNFE